MKTIITVLMLFSAFSTFAGELLLESGISHEVIGQVKIVSVGVNADSVYIKAEKGYCHIMTKTREEAQQILTNINLGAHVRCVGDVLIDAQGVGIKAKSFGLQAEIKN